MGSQGWEDTAATIRLALQAGKVPFETMDLAEGCPDPRAFGQHVQSVDSRWRPVVRSSLSIGASLVICETVWRLIPKALAIHTTTIGYAIFANFNINRYTDGYVLIGFVFPIVACVAYALASWIGPLRKVSKRKDAFLPFSRAGMDVADGGRHQSGATGEPTSLPLDVFWSAGRLALVAAVIALELSAGQSRTLQSNSNVGYYGSALFLLIVVAVGLSVETAAARYTAMPNESAWRMRQKLISISRVNSLAALAVIPGLYFMSRATGVAVASDHHMVRYPWLPLWLTIALSGFALALWFRWNRGCPSRTTEANVLLWIVGPVFLYLVVANLPGALGAFQGFDDAQNLAGPQLVLGHGLLPWRDLFLVHGLLADVFKGAIGMVVFGNTRWGATAGEGVYVLPAFWLTIYFFAAYFSRRNRVLMLGLGVIVVSGLLQVPSPQFLIVPICLVLFARVIERSTWGRCAALTLCVVISMILVPEATVFEIAVLPLVVVYEICTRTGSAKISHSFTRSFRCFSVGLLSTLGWIVYLLATGSLSAFLHFYLEFSTDNALSKGLPVQWVLHTDLLSTFSFFAPMVLWLMTIGRTAAKVVRRSPWSSMDWTMVAAATMAILYFPKVVQRADAGHAAQVLDVCIPLLFLWGIELLGVLDRGLHRLAGAYASSLNPAGRAMRSTRFAATVGAMVVVLALTTSISTVGAIPGRFHPIAPQEPPSTPRLGYTVPGAVDTNLINDLGTIIDRYAGLHAPVMDFSNQLGIIYYALDRTPSTRYYHIDEAATAGSQRTAIDEIRHSNPPVVVFSSTVFGLSVFDYMPMMVRDYAVSEYLLNHYRPLVSIESELILVRNDLARHQKPLPSLSMTAVKNDLYFNSYPCDFGESFNFFITPGDLGSLPRVSAQLVATGAPGVSKLVFPPGTDLLNYRWVDLRSDISLGNSAFIISDAVPAQPSHSIDVESLPASGRQMDALVSGCIQWHGYHPSSLYLTTNIAPGGHLEFSLIK